MLKKYFNIFGNTVHRFTLPEEDETINVKLFVLNTALESVHG